MELEVLGLGFSCMDDLLLLSEIPPPEGRATVLRRDRQGGGMAATALAAVGKLGGRGGFIASTGDDETGRQVLEEFRHYGVDVSRSVVRPGARSHVTIVLVDHATGARAFLTNRGNVPELAPDELDETYVKSARVMHLSDASPAALQAARWAREAGRQVTFDGTHFHPSVFALAPLVDYLIVSRFFASEYVAHRQGRDVGRFARDFANATVPAAPLSQTVAAAAPPTHPSRTAPPETGATAGEAPVPHPAADVEPLHGEQLGAAARLLLDLGARVVVVTEGEHGCWCAGPDGDLYVPAFQVQPVDTTGAGDVFHGAFALAHARDWDLRRALRFAAAVAALKCRALGGRAGIPTFDQAMALATSSAQA